MMKGREHFAISASKSRLESDDISGVNIELFECANDTGKPIKEGYIYRPTNTQQINFVSVASNELGHIQMKERVGAKFWIKSVGEQPSLENLVGDGLRFQSKCVLKPVLCADISSDVFPRILFACQNFDCTFDEWLNNSNNVTRAFPLGDYLSDDGKDIIRSGWTAIDDICNLGFTSSDLDKSSSYVMIGTYIAILPTVLHPQTLNPEDEKHSMRVQYANMLDQKIFPLWNDPELNELTSFMRLPQATSEQVLRHPVLSDPVERQLLYRDGFSKSFTPSQIHAINLNIAVDPNWQKAACQDLGLGEIIRKHAFTVDSVGALHFAKIVACHYLQNLIKANKNWKGGLVLDFVDKLLKWCLPLVLCQFYRLKTSDPAFQNS